MSEPQFRNIHFSAELDDVIRVNREFADDDDDAESVDGETKDTPWLTLLMATSSPGTITASNQQEEMARQAKWEALKFKKGAFLTADEHGVSPPRRRGTSPRRKRKEEDLILNVGRRRFPPKLRYRQVYTPKAQEESFAKSQAYLEHLMQEKHRAAAERVERLRIEQSVRYKRYVGVSVAVVHAIFASTLMQRVKVNRAMAKLKAKLRPVVVSWVCRRNLKQENSTLADALESSKKNVAPQVFAPKATLEVHHSAVQLAQVLSLKYLDECTSVVRFDVLNGGKSMTWERALNMHEECQAYRTEGSLYPTNQRYLVSLREHRLDLSAPLSDDELLKNSLVALHARSTIVKGPLRKMFKPKSFFSGEPICTSNDDLVTLVRSGSVAVVIRSPPADVQLPMMFTQHFPVECLVGFDGEVEPLGADMIVVARLTKGHWFDLRRCVQLYDVPEYLLVADGGCDVFQCPLQEVRSLVTEDPDWEVRVALGASAVLFPRVGFKLESLGVKRSIYATRHTSEGEVEEPVECGKYGMKLLQVPQYSVTEETATAWVANEANPVWRCEAVMQFCETLSAVKQLKWVRLWSQHLRVVVFDVSTVLVREGYPMASMLLVVGGTADIWKSGKRVAMTSVADSGPFWVNGERNILAAPTSPLHRSGNTVRCAKTVVALEVPAEIVRQAALQADKSVLAAMFQTKGELTAGQKIVFQPKTPTTPGPLRSRSSLSAKVDNAPPEPRWKNIKPSSDPEVVSAVEEMSWLAGRKAIREHCSYVGTLLGKARVGWERAGLNIDMLGGRESDFILGLENYRRRLLKLLDSKKEVKGRKPPVPVPPLGSTEPAPPARRRPQTSRPPPPDRPPVFTGVRLIDHETRLRVKEEAAKNAEANREEVLRMFFPDEEL